MFHEEGCQVPALSPCREIRKNINIFIYFHNTFRHYKMGYHICVSKTKPGIEHRRSGQDPAVMSWFLMSTWQRSLTTEPWSTRSRDFVYMRQTATWTQSPPTGFTMVKTHSHKTINIFCLKILYIYILKIKIALNSINDFAITRSSIQSRIALSDFLECYRHTHFH